MANKWHPQNGLTLYGRKPALEALANRALEIAQLHLADSNRPGGIIAQIIAQAESRNIPIQYHEKQALSRISKNGRQDQGVALDITCPRFGSIDSLLSGDRLAQRRLLALDGITNPQNVGMIIRSAVAAGVDGVLYPKQGVAALGPLVIKASAGTVFRAPLIWCDALAPALQTLKTRGYAIATLEASAPQSLFSYHAPAHTVFVLGGETSGVGDDVSQLTDQRLAIPMSNEVESLNVAVTAALVAFHLTTHPD